MNKKSRVFYNGDYLHDFLIDKDGNIYENGFGLTLLEGAILEYWTGLTDKAETDIYEGDIMDHKYHNFDVSKGEPRAIKMGEGSDSDGWAHCAWFGWKCGGSSLIDICKYCEIIGNIHENGELLR